MNRHHAKAEVPQKTRVIGFRITDHEHQKIIEAQQALRSLGIIGTTSDILRSILKDFKVESWLDDSSKRLRRTRWIKKI